MSKANTRTLPNNIVMTEVERMLEADIEVTLKVKGRSMMPFIRGERDSVILKRAECFKVGDILLAHLTTEDRYVIHRLYKIGDDDTMILLGDGNQDYVERCRRSDIKGIVTTIITPKGNIDPYSTSQRFAAALWRIARPVRGYLLRIFSIFTP